MDLPEDGPHLIGGRLVRGDAIGVESQAEVVGILQKILHEVAVGRAILNVLEHPGFLLSLETVLDPFEEISIY